jgi:hypothetical protein
MEMGIEFTCTDGPFAGIALKLGSFEPNHPKAGPCVRFERHFNKAAFAAAKIPAKTTFALARTSGEQQVLRTWSEPCDGSTEECSWDQVVEYALPDGTTVRERCHTH